MAAPAITLTQLKALHPCADRLDAVAGMVKFGRRKITAAQAVEAGIGLDDLVWVCSALSRTDPDIERRLRLWMADCAARVLHIYERDNPDDHRVCDAIIAARQFARGEIPAAARDAARGAAWAAAWAARGAAWAARGAAWAAARAAAGAARDAAWAARGAAWAARGAAWAAARAAWDAEEQWQITRLVAWMSDAEPDDWPLDTRVSAAA